MATQPPPVSGPTDWVDKISKVAAKRAWRVVIPVGIASLGVFGTFAYALYYLATDLAANVTQQFSISTNAITSALQSANAQFQTSTEAINASFDRSASALEAANEEFRRQLADHRERMSAFETNLEGFGERAQADFLEALQKTETVELDVNFRMGDIETRLDGIYDQIQVGDRYIADMDGRLTTIDASIRELLNTHIEPLFVAFYNYKTPVPRRMLPAETSVIEYINLNVEEGQFAKFNELLVEENAIPMLDGSGFFTLLIPIDEGMASVFIENYIEALKEQGRQGQFLQNHILPGNWTLPEGDEVGYGRWDTNPGQTIDVAWAGEHRATVGNARILIRNVLFEQRGKVVHVIDRPLQAPMK